MIRVVIEEVAGQHHDLCDPGKPRYCECGGDAVRDSDSCLYCGKYIRGLFNPVDSGEDLNFRMWQRFVRERPHAYGDLEAA